ncbi:DNA polymerase III subunit epsilon, partial [Lacticaseibacillus paracasei subsp. paracasei Lpp7]
EPVHPEPVISRIRRSLHDFVVFDIETTGLNASSDEIIQLSAIKVHDDEVVDTFDCYLKPQRKIPEKIVYLTGITNELVEEASPIDEIMPQFVKFTAGFPLVGHNIIRFDLPFILRNGFYREKIEALDTLILARKTDFPDSISNFKLPTLKQYFGITNTSHNAIEDCRTNMVVYQRIRDGKLEATPAPIVKPTHELAKLRFAIT